MKKRTVLIIFSILLNLTSCHNRLIYFTNLTEKTFPATESDSIELYYAPEKPERPFEVIGSVKVIVHSMGQDERKSLTGMKLEAARRGANAILNITISDAGLNVNTGERDASFVGLAVKWKQ